MFGKHTLIKAGSACNGIVKIIKTIVKTCFSSTNFRSERFRLKNTHKFVYKYIIKLTEFMFYFLIKKYKTLLYKKHQVNIPLIIDLKKTKTKKKGQINLRNESFYFLAVCFYVFYICFIFERIAYKYGPNRAFDCGRFLCY